MCQRGDPPIGDSGLAAQDAESALETLESRLMVFDGRVDRAERGECSRDREAFGPVLCLGGGEVLLGALDSLPPRGGFGARLALELVDQRAEGRVGVASGSMLERPQRLPQLRRGVDSPGTLDDADGAAL